MTPDAKSALADRLSAPQPLVLPLAPARGWAGASRGRRVLAALAPTFVLTVWLAYRLPGLSPGRHVYAVVVLFAGPFAYCALARVLRPHPPGTSRERTVRHMLASTAMAWGPLCLSFVTIPSAQPPPLVILAGVLAFLLGIMTVIWGVFAMAVRGVPVER